MMDTSKGQDFKVTSQLHLGYVFQYVNLFMNPQIIYVCGNGNLCKEKPKSMYINQKNNEVVPNKHCKP